MSTSRRDFLRTSAALGGVLGLGLTPDSASATPAPDAPAPTPAPARRAVKPLRILILGGTGFIGPHEVRYAEQRGHTLTLFNRGKTNPGLFPDIEKLEGDRDGRELTRPSRAASGTSSSTTRPCCRGGSVRPARS